MKVFRYVAAAALVFCCVSGAFARETDKHDVRRGNRHFKDGEYKEAMVDYQKALLRDSTSFAASYNMANTLYRMDKPAEGKAVLDSIAGAAPESGHAADLHYNAGNMALATKDYAAAVDAYKAALLLNPGDIDAKENYIYAKKKLEDQQNQQQNRQDNKDNKDNQDNKDDRDEGNGQNDQDRQDGGNDRNDDGNQDGNGSQDRQDNAGQSPQDQPAMSWQSAQQMLNAIMAKEKETQEKVKKEKAAVLKSKQKEKNW